MWLAVFLCYYATHSNGEGFECVGTESRSDSIATCACGGRKNINEQPDVHFSLTHTTHCITV